MYNEIIFFNAFLVKRMLLNDKVEMFFPHVMRNK